MNKQLTKRFLSIAMIVFGFVFGVNWKNSVFCFGDYVFSIFGIPAWSNGRVGTHYPGVITLILILAGLVILNTTLSKRARLWTGAIVILILIILNLCSIHS